MSKLNPGETPKGASSNQAVGLYARLLGPAIAVVAERHRQEGAAALQQTYIDQPPRFDLSGQRGKTATAGTGPGER